VATAVEAKPDKKDKRPSTSHFKIVPETRELRDRLRAEAHAFGQTLDTGRDRRSPCCDTVS